MKSQIFSPSCVLGITFKTLSGCPAVCSFVFSGTLMCDITRCTKKSHNACDDHKAYILFLKSYPSISSCLRIIHSLKSPFPGHYLTQTIVITVVNVWAVGKP